MKRSAIVFLVGLFCLALIGPATAKPIKVRFSHVVAENTPKGWAAQEFARRVNEELAGRVDVQVFPNARLFNDDQAVEALSDGFVEMIAPSSAMFSGSIPQLQLLDEPFLFVTREAVFRTLDGPIGQELIGLFQEIDLKALAFWDNGFKHFSNNVRPLTKPEDFQAVNFRIMSSDILEAQMKQLGAAGLKLPFPEVYKALEQGVVDGQENTASNIFTQKFHTVQKYMTLSRHGYIGYVVTTSKQFWNSVPEDIRSKMAKIMAEVTEQQRQKAKELNEADLAKIKEYAEKSGELEIYTLNRKEKAALQAALEPVHRMFPDIVKSEWIEQILRMQ